MQENLEEVRSIQLATKKTKLELDLLRHENASLSDECREWKAADNELATTVEKLQGSRLHEAEASEIESINLAEMMVEIASLKAQKDQDEAIYGQDMHKLRRLIEQKDTIHLETIRKLEEEASLTKKGHEEAIEKANELQIAHARELDGLTTKLSNYCAENAVLGEKLRRQEQNSRAEKVELCNMLKEAEERHVQEVRNLEKGVLSRQEHQQKLRLERESLQAAHDKELESLSTKLTDESSKKVSKMLAKEKQLKLRETKLIEENEELRGTIKKLEEKRELDARQFKEKVDSSIKAQRDLKSELSKLQADHAKEQEKMMTELVDSKIKEAELADLKEVIRQQEGFARSEEEEQLREALESVDDKFREEIRQLREELFWAEESQKQLKSEISEAFEENANLKERLHRHEQSSRDEKEELCKMLKAAEEAHQMETRELSDELLRTKESQRQMKLESSKLQAAHAEEQEKMMTQTLDYFNKDAEIASLKDVIDKQEDHIQEEKERIRSNLKAHFEEVRGLKEEFVQTQESHRQHLHQILESLQTLELQRAKEVAHILEELDSVKKEKKGLMKGLTTELTFELDNHSNRVLGLPTIEEDPESVSENELGNFRACLDKKTALRSKYSQEFSGTLQKLQRAVKPENLKYIIDKIKKKRDSNIEAKVFGEIHRMSVVLGEIYRKEGDSLRLIDQAMLASLDRAPEISVATPVARSRALREPNLLGRRSDPDRVLQDLEQRVAAIEKQNTSLKNQLNVEGKRRNV